jgi:hypothetical protein
MKLMCFPQCQRGRLLDIFSLMSTVDVMISCYDELSFTIDEIVIDVNSILVSRRSEQYEDKTLEGKTQYKRK